MLTRPLQTLYTGQHTQQQGVAEGFWEGLPEVLVLEVVETTWVEEAVEGGDDVVGPSVARGSTAGQQDKHQGEVKREKQKTPPKQQGKLKNAPSLFP